SSEVGVVPQNYILEDVRPYPIQRKRPCCELVEGGVDLVSSLHRDVRREDPPDGRGGERGWCYPRHLRSQVRSCAALGAPCRQQPPGRIGAFRAWGEKRYRLTV